MTTFIEDLWTSIFTPGPTSTLLLATNVSFGALQTVLLALLIATYSIHFLVLSVLSAGLWWSINWFAVEVAAVRAAEEEEKRLRRERGEKIEGEDEGEEQGTETILSKKETSTTQATIPGTPAPVNALDELNRLAATGPSSPVTLPSTAPLASVEGQAAESEQTPTKGTWNTSIAARLAPVGPEETTVRMRQTAKGRMAESMESVSTDSEWEKVEEMEGDV